MCGVFCVWRLLSAAAAAAAVLRDPTPEEVEMQAEVEQLRVKLEGLKELTPGETDTISELQAELDDREKALYKLQVRHDTYNKHMFLQREMEATHSEFVFMHEDSTRAFLALRGIAVFHAVLAGETMANAYMLLLCPERLLAASHLLLFCGMTAACCRLSLMIRFASAKAGVQSGNTA
jgi:hypothetical protein